MPQVLFRVMAPDNQAKFDDLVNTLAKAYGYPETVLDAETAKYVPNPETKHAYLKRTRKEAILEDYKRQKRQDASQTLEVADPGLGE